MHENLGAEVGVHWLALPLSGNLSLLMFIAVGSLVVCLPEACVCFDRNCASR